MVNQSKSQEFKRDAERIFLAANPTATITGWTFGPAAVTWRDNTPGYSGAFNATAPGYRARKMFATQDADGIMVR